MITCITEWWTSPHPCLWPSEPVEDASVVPDHDYVARYQLTVNQPVESYTQVYLEYSTTVLRCPCPNLFELDVFLASNSE